MNNYTIDLSSLVTPPHTDSISGRRFGEKHASDSGLLEKIDQGHIDIIISESVIKSINDSFIKGFFNEVFKKYKKKDFVKEHVTIVASENFKNLFDKNWSILEAIYND
jgi:hypothetical protein